jgi:ferredoxin
VDCFYEGANFLAINPSECIDCALCIPECPVDAIITDDNEDYDVPFWLELNARLSAQWPNITIPKAPLDYDDEWLNKDNKIDHLIESEN